ncbi:hypothetical protein ABZ883_14575 [Streptomyces sp. NPDC046977]|uniref:hypothetical protein n=1 Tax=Streptomyces sp. NPDC046977 TaxID=3154703 RepID=UPI0033DE55A1
MQRKRTAAGIAADVEAAGLLMSPETAAELAGLRARVAELDAGIAWRDAERERWADVHSLVERAIDKGYSSVDTYQLEDALGPEPEPATVETTQPTEQPRCGNAKCGTPITRGAQWCSTWCHQADDAAKAEPGGAS